MLVYINSKIFISIKPIKKTSMGLVIFKKQLGELNDRRSKVRKLMYWMIFTLLLSILLYNYVIDPIINKHPPVNFLSPIILILMIVVVIFSFLKKINQKRLTMKEKMLFNLSLFLTNLANYLETKDSRHFENSKRSLRRARNFLDEINFIVLGTEAEKKNNRFIEELILYVDIEMLPKFRIGAPDEVLQNIHSKGETIFNNFWEENFVISDHEIQKAVADYKEKRKTPLLRRYGIDTKKLISWFISLIVVSTIFLIYWLSTKLFDFHFSIGWGIAIAVGLPSAVYSTRKIIEDLKSK